MDIFSDPVLLARLQFACTAAYHFIFVPLTIGLGLILAINETRYYRSRDPKDAAATKFWVKIFTATFVLGLATGITMEFSFGTNWADYSRFVGDIFGAPLAAEALTRIQALYAIEAQVRGKPPAERALLRRQSRISDEASPIIEFGEARVDLSRRVVTRAGEPVHLTPIEYRLLTSLLAQPDRVGDVARHRHQRALGNAVRKLIRFARVRIDRADVHHAPAAAPAHAGKHRLHEVERRLDEEVELVLVVAPRTLLDGQLRLRPRRVC